MEGGREVGCAAHQWEPPKALCGHAGTSGKYGCREWIIGEEMCADDRIRRCFIDEASNLVGIERIASDDRQCHRCPEWNECFGHFREAVEPGG